MIDGELIGCIIFAIAFYLLLKIKVHLDLIKQANYNRYIYECRRTIKLLNGGQTITTDMED